MCLFYFSSIHRPLHPLCRTPFVRKGFGIWPLLAPFWILHLVCDMKQGGCTRLVEEERRLLCLDPVVVMLDMFTTRGCR